MGVSTGGRDYRREGLQVGGSRWEGLQVGGTTGGRE